MGAEGLAGPDQAKLVRAGKDGTPITDGVFPETKEFLAGYWIIDVENLERACAIAAEASAAPGVGPRPRDRRGVDLGSRRDRALVPGDGRRGAARALRRRAGDGIR